MARAQHALMELAEKLTHRGVTVKYAIHPVVGCMNVLLAEAEVPYEQVFEMDDINSEFGQADVVLVPTTWSTRRRRTIRRRRSPACRSSRPTKPRP